MLNDRDFRLDLVTRSHYWFCHFYFAHYITFETAEFQKEMFQLTELENEKLIVVVAFRGSGKSTVFTLSNPIWSILGSPQKKFVIILGQTQRQARQYLVNLKQELERNTLLLRDLGPFQEERDEWGGYSLVIPKYGARITAASSEQSIRGLRHMQHRPDLIVCDDLEDLQSVKTKEGRDKIESWLFGDVVPAGGDNTKIIIVGNLLHNDSLLMKLRRKIEEKKLSGIFRTYPLINDSDEILWPGRFPTPESIERLKQTIGNESAWQREFLLRIIPEDDQVVLPEYIQYYDILPDKNNTEYRFTWFAVDLAISKRDTADFTAIIGAQVHGYGEDLKIYILPYIVNKRLTFPETVDQIKLIFSSYPDSNLKVLTENVAYQASIFQQLQREGYAVEGVRILGDKRERLASLTHLLPSAKVLFPRHGAELAIQQLIGFGVEKFDDLVDSFTLLIHKIIENNHGKPDIIWLDLGPSERGWRSVSSFEDLFRR